MIAAWAARSTHAFVSNLQASMATGGICQKKTLVGDLRRMIQQGDCFSDMVFVCADGGEVPALRMLVAVRSPFLESLLMRRDMAEAGSACIHLPEMESSTMRICMEFFYTDTVQHSSWSHGSILLPMKVIAAAHYFLVDALQQVAISYLLSTTTWMSSYSSDADGEHDICSRLADTPMLFEEIVLAFDLGVDLHQALPCALLDEVLKRLGHVVDMGLLAQGFSDYHKRLSQEALLHLLKNQIFPWGDASMWEYRRFQHIIRWCANQVLQYQEEVLLQDILSCTSPRLYDGDSVHDNTKQDGIPQIRTVCSSMAILVTSFLDMVCLYLQDIPLTILSNVIEPLNILPTSMLASAHMLQTTEDVWEDIRTWVDFPASGHKNANFFFCQSGPFSGIAPRNLCEKFQGARMISWEIVIVNSCNYFMVGFGLARPRKIGEKFDGSNEWSWSLDSLGCLHHNGEMIRQCGSAAKFGIEGRDTVEVRLDMHQKQCSFLICRKLVKNASLTDLPLNGQVYPALHMHQGAIVFLRFRKLNKQCTR